LLNFGDLSRTDFKVFLQVTFEGGS
jgi:hypothetical protein